MRLRLFVLLFFSSILSFPYSVCAQTGGPSHGAAIKGTVYDPDGRAVPLANVSLLNPLSPVATTQTDSAGAYQFEGLRSGAFVVVANLPGLTGISAELKLEDGETSSTDLHLKLSAVQESVVVSASLSGVIAPEIGSSVTVVSQEEIQDQGVETVADALRNVAGVAINRTGQEGAVTSAFIRGGNSNYNLVMVDGIPLNDFGGGFDLAPLPTDGVDQVELTRGPESALYGSNAVAGVINVVSDQGEGSPHFSFAGEGGSFDTWRLTTEGAGLTHGFSWAYDLSRISTQGVRPYDTYRNQTSFVSLGYSRSPRRKFTAHFFGDAGRAESPGPFGSDPDDLYPGFAAGASTQTQDLFGYQANYTEQFSALFPAGH